METLSYVKGYKHEIEIGEELYFGELWDGEGDGIELLQSGAISPDEENVAEFKVIDNVTAIENLSGEELLDILVKVTDIY